MQRCLRSSMHPTPNPYCTASVCRFSASTTVLRSNGYLHYPVSKLIRCMPFGKHGKSCRDLSHKELGVNHAHA